MNTNRHAILWVLAANVIWGVSPLFWKLLQETPAERILIHRALWSALMLLMILSKHREGLRQILKNRKNIVAILASSALLAINWHTYLWAIAQGRVMEASLGYFLLPLFNIILGALFLREKLARRKQLALMVIAASVALKVLQLGVFPWIALVLGGSFATYILIRKINKPCPVAGLFFECCFMVVSALALGQVAGEGFARPSFWGDTNAENVLLLISGAITVIPMVMLLRAAPQVSMQCMGLASYLLPTLMWLVAVAAFGEAVQPEDLLCLGGIWLGVLGFFAPTAKRSDAGMMRQISALEKNRLLSLDPASPEAI